MYEYIQGILSQIHPTYLVVTASGLAYKIYSPNAYVWNRHLNEEVQVYLELVVREDSLTLYGFKDMQEKELFNLLNRVSNIGPKSALSILALNDHTGLVQAIESQNVTYLTKFPGVGKKTAQQMILDLQGKLGDFVANDGAELAPSQQASSSNQAQFDEVAEALAGLGYSQREIKAIAKPMALQSFASTQEALSFAFKLLVS